ncbi:MAG: squalene synthase HpnC [Pseudomonadota bacterium]|nr:squalene synthase HpnC [Pseudomonadota bacterium]
MSGEADLASGKGHRDENFPVASWLIAPRHRAVVLAFYRVARMADDIADHPTAAPADKLAGLAAVESSLTGADDANAEAVTLRHALDERGLTNRHSLDLLEAFRRDVVKNRTADWADLMDYCRYSAAPVGRFVLDVHGESDALWPACDALCAALQVINHLQDCGKDYRDLNRVYVPLDLMSDAGVPVEALGGRRAGGALRNVFTELAGRTGVLLDEAGPLAGAVGDTRLAVEIGVIARLAVSLNGRLVRRDPLCERVHHHKAEVVALALLGAGEVMGSRLGLGRRAKLMHR